MNVSKSRGPGSVEAPIATSSPESSAAPEQAKKPAATPVDQRESSTTSVSSAFKQLASERAGNPAEPANAGETGANAAIGRGFAGRVHAAPTEKVEVNPSAIVWANEGFVRSKGKTELAPIVGEVRLSDAGIKVQLLHVSGGEPIDSVQGHEPFADGAKVPTDAFIQAQTVQALNAFLGRIASFGLDLNSVYRDNIANDGVIRVFVNAADILNAAYVPGRNIYFFGNYKGQFPLAMDKDTVVHESSHGLLDHIVPFLNHTEGIEGGAFHEAFGDIMATLMWRNAGVGEDLGTFLTLQKQGDLKNGIRRVDNKEVLDPSVEEEHDRSLPYSGLMWSTYQVLSQAMGDENKAADVMMGAIIKGCFYMNDKQATSADIVQGLAEGLSSHLGQVAPEQASTVLRAFLDEAKARGMLKSEVTERAQPKDVPAESAADVLKIVQSQKAIAERKDLSFEVMRDVVFNNVRKVTIRPVMQVGDQKLPVEDSSLTVLIEDGKLHTLDNINFHAPRPIALKGGFPSIEKAVEAARSIIKEQLVEAAKEDESAAKILESFDTIFDPKNMDPEWVVSGGTLCLGLRTLAGDFTVDVSTGEVRRREMMRIERDSQS